MFLCKNISLILLIFISYSNLTGCSLRITNDPEASVDRLAQSGDIKKEVDALAQPLIDNKENIGIVVATRDSVGNLAHYSYGERNKEIHSAMQPDQLFGIGSVSKSLVVSLLLALDAKNVVSLNDTIGNILPSSMTFGDPRVADITLFQLASHTSGLPREPVSLSSLNALLRYTFTGENLYSHITLPFLYDYLQVVYLPNNPTEKGIYSNIGIGLLAHLLTLKTNTELESLLQQYIFRPLHMKNTVIGLTEKNKLMLATGYSGDQPFFIARNTALENWVFSPAMVGTGGIYSTAPDLMKFLLAHLGKSRTHLDQVFKQAQKIQASSKRQQLTMGWYVETVERYNQKLYFYHGMISGFSCYIGFEPKSGVAVVVLRNNFNWVDPIGKNLLLRLSLAATQKE